MGAAMRAWWAVGLGLGGCTGEVTAECEGWDEVFVYADADADGFGSDRVGWVCTPAPTESIAAGDCDDADPLSFPNADEVCDLVDNDCNGVVDDGVVLVTWYEDADGDTFGDRASEPSCIPPEGPWIRLSGDCDDEDPAVNPLVREVCNDADDDCDGETDDEDAGVDPTTETLWFRDGDGDGFGDDANVSETCDPPSELFIAVGGDCDDTRPGIFPGGNEFCNLRDDDCDGFTDDEDDSIDPAGQTEFFEDADLDGFGNPDQLTLACRPIPGAVRNGDDCDDTEPTATVVRDWYDDDDLDGVGAGPVLATACYAPTPFGSSPEGDDCDDADPAKFPGNPEVCEDGFDQDCSGADRQCATWLYTVEEGTDRLQRWDAQTGVFETIGPLGVVFDFGDLAYDEQTSTLYMVDGRGAQGLYTVDMLTGAATLVGIHGVPDLFGLAWDPSTDTLYTSAWFPFGLHEIDITTANTSLVGNPNMEHGALAYDSTRDRLLAMREGIGDLHELNRNNAAVTFVTNQGFVDNSGMAYVPETDLIYVIDWSGNLYEYDPNNSYTRTALGAGLGSHDGLVYVPNPPN